MVVHISEETHGGEGALPLRLHEKRLQTLNAVCVSVGLEDAGRPGEKRFEIFLKTVTNCALIFNSLSRSPEFSP